MKKNPELYKVAEINRYIKNLLQGDLLLRDIRVTGEISNFVHHRSGHMYFSLKDSSASLRSVFFRRENSRLLFRPENGMEVIAHGNVSVYEPDGVYQLYVSELEPAGIGSLYLAYEQLKKKLEAEGLFRREDKKKIPYLAKKIGLVTSPSGAALQDIITTIKNRFPHVELLVVESLVQGLDAGPDLVRAIKVLNKTPGVELIILARGGGSLEDLWPFNEEIVARAIYSSRLPVISAVGHETDFTIADFAADLRAATPTAAAQIAVPALEELEAALKRLRERATLALQQRLQKEKQLLDQITGERIIRMPGRRLALAKDHLDKLDRSMKREIVRNLQLKAINLRALGDKLDSYSPLKIMSRGYSYCRDEKGKIIRTVKDLQVGELLQLNFRDGTVYSRAERIKEEKILNG